MPGVCPHCFSSIGGRNYRVTSAGQYGGDQCNVVFLVVCHENASSSTHFPDALMAKQAIVEPSSGACENSFLSPAHLQDASVWPVKVRGRGPAVSRPNRPVRWRCVGNPSGSRQLWNSQASQSEEVACSATTLSRPLHTDRFFLAQPDRTLVRRNHTQTNPPRNIR